MTSNIQEEIGWISQLAECGQSMFRLLQAIEERKKHLYGDYNDENKEELKRINERALTIISLIKNKSYLTKGELEKHALSLHKSRRAAKKVAQQLELTKQEVAKVMEGILETIKELDRLLKKSAEYLDAAQFEYDKETHLIELLPKALPDCKEMQKVRYHHKNTLLNKLSHITTVRQSILNLNQTEVLNKLNQMQLPEALPTGQHGVKWTPEECMQGMESIIKLMIELCTVLVHEYVFTQSTEELMLNNTTIGGK